jgi:DNA-binding NarL/FixJ family response regulator
MARRQPAKRNDPTPNSAPIATVPRRRDAPARAVLLANGGIAIEDGITVTRREAEVMECVAAGLNTPQIAAEFGISRDAIDKCIQRLLISVGMPNRVALAAWWTEVTMDLYAQSVDNQ